eukprot:8816064-Alexandrium_andersonii.AAC.1
MPTGEHRQLWEARQRAHVAARPRTLAPAMPTGAAAAHAPRRCLPGAGAHLPDIAQPLRSNSLQG